MPDNKLVAEHYTHGALIGAIESGIATLGKTPETVTVDDLGAVDEFHIGGSVATQTFLEQLELSAKDHVLDAGCGLGGASRFAAHRYGCSVTGIDLTAEFVDTGNTLSEWVALADAVTLHCGDATATPFPARHFDKIFMLHVGMNIAAKDRLAVELRRVLKDDGRLGIYDVMQMEIGSLAYPVPWASDVAGSALATPADYKQALSAAGFRVTNERNRAGFAQEFFARLQASAAAADGPPPLGLHLLMGSSTPIKVRNMIQNISAGLIAPVELIAEPIAQ